jgi:hypothetical protein
MPLLANLIGLLASFFWGIFSKYMASRLALQVAGYTAWIAVLAAFAASVLVSMQALSSGLQAAYSALGSPSPSNWPGYIAMGIGMVIPSSAPSILGFVAAVWIATSVVRIKKQGIEHFTK